MATLPPPFLGTWRASLRERIWQQIEQRLTTITLAHGWPFTVHVLARGAADPLAIQSYPCAMVIPATDEPESGAYDTNRRVLSLLVRVWVRPHANQQVTLEPVLTAVTLVMMQDPILGGLCDNLDEGATTFVYAELGGEDAGAEIEYTVSYRTKAGDPTLTPAEPQP
jgi:hypothetical protein